MVMNAVSSSPSSPPSAASAAATVPVTMAVTSTVPPGARSASPCSAATPYGQPNSRCCDSGRTIFTDPITGQTVCSCQYDLLNYPRLAAAGGLVTATGPGGVPLGVYPEGMAAYLSGMGAEQPSFYSNPAGLDLKENLVGGGAPWPYPAVYHPYEFAGYPFNSYGMDLNGARRKNATRETTSTLKAWLNEHKKNPYPTKGEKIMLAIITKMTLTQVSTWFANARRRLKKENKMTWEPRNRVDDDDANVDDDDHKSNDDKDMLDAKDSGVGSNEDNDRQSHRLDMLDRPEGNTSEWSGSRPGSPNGSPELYERPVGGHPLFHPAALHHLRPPAGSPPELSLHHHHPHHPASGSTNSSLVSKPRIWSLADMASKDGKDSKDGSGSEGGGSGGGVGSMPHNSIYGHPQQHSSPGKILSPLAARIPNYSPYVRPDLYRGFYGPTAAHLTGHSQEFLEHQRSFNATLAAHNGLSMNPLLWKAAVSSAGGGPPFAPLSLTTNNHHVAPPSGASPSASSTSSSIGCDAPPPMSSNQGHQGPSSGHSTSSSSSGKLSPPINVTTTGSGKP